MADLQAMVFWLSGVFAPSFSDLLFNTVSIDDRSTKDLSALIGFQELNDQLSLGLIDDNEYCKTIFNETHLVIKPEAIIERILASLTSNDSVYEILNLIPKNFQFWLIVDYPESWIKNISERLDVNRTFPIERTIMLSKFGLSNISPELFQSLPEHIGLPIERCLLIDSNTKRVINAVNYGLPSIIYFDASRLKREFKLRKLI